MADFSICLGVSGDQTRTGGVLGEVPSAAVRGCAAVTNCEYILVGPGFASKVCGLWNHIYVTVKS